MNLQPVCFIGRFRLAVDSMADFLWGILFILAFACTVGVTAACSDLGDLYNCSSVLASSTDPCFLSLSVRCDCLQSCNSRPSCEEGEKAELLSWCCACSVQDDDDTLCDCIFYGHFCEQYPSWYPGNCPTTCARRLNVTCDPLLEVEGTTHLYNNRAPTTATPLYRDFVTYKCKDGWLEVSGPFLRPLKRVCMLDGSWLLDPDYQSPNLVCERVSCGAVPAAPHLTSPSQNTGVFEDSVTYTCAAGYSNTGPGEGNHTCNASALWERIESDPVCTRVDCGAVPAVPSSMSASRSSGVFEDMVTYSCAAGYSNTGPGKGTHTCNASALWERFESDPVCTPNPCVAVPTIPNAVPSSPSGSYRDIITYSCASGYKQSEGETGQHTCTVAGTWFRDRNDPVCTIESCGAPPAVNDASPSVTSGTYNDKVTYKCDVGFNLTSGGFGQRYCSAAGSWVLFSNDTDPVCLGVSCGSPPVVVGATPSSAIGYFLQHVTYTCKASYTPLGGGKGKARCKADGLWETNTTYDPAPMCLGEFVKFINSEAEINHANVPPTGTLPSVDARSNLHCASLCAASVHCHGYTFNKDSKVCTMNTGSPLPVVSKMKKLYD